jgi:hypothetical protein
MQVGELGHVGVLQGIFLFGISSGASPRSISSVIAYRSKSMPGDGVSRAIGRAGPEIEAYAAAPPGRYPPAAKLARRLPPTAKTRCLNRFGESGVMCPAFAESGCWKI